MALTAKDLKNAILQMAMEGKLVEQKPEEGTGKELLATIHPKEVMDADAERQGTETPFDIPETWIWTQLKQICVKPVKRGKSPKYSAFGDTLVFAQKCNTKEGFIDISLALHLDESTLSKYPKEEFMQDSDIVINSTGGGTLGRVGIYHDADNPNSNPIVPDSHVTVIRTHSSVDSRFTYWVLKFYQPYMESLGEGSTNQTELKPQVVQNLLFPLPPLAEQKRIVAKIESILPSLDAFERAQTKLDELNASYKEGMKKSILQYAMEGKLVSQDPKEEPASALLDRIQEEKKKLIKEKKIKADKNESVIFRRNGFFYERIGKEEKCIDDEIPFEIPESWEWTRLKNIASTQLGKALNTSKDQGELVPYLCSINVYWNTIDVSQVKKARFSVDEKKKFSVQPGDIFVVEGGDAGRTAIWEGKDQVYYQNALHRVRFLPKAIVPLFFVFLMKTYKGLGLLGGKSKGMTIQHFVKHELDALLFPLPAFAEQKRIVATIKTIFADLDGN